LSREKWRFIDSGALPGAENMALDEAILEAHIAGEAPTTLRVYSWRPSAVSLGRFQRVESAVDLHACRRLGVDVVRRPTGGRAILHTADEVTFSLVVSAARLGAGGIMECYRTIAGGIITALGLLGLEARLLERSSASASPAAARDPACFAVKARCDLVVGARKLVGSAQVQRRGFLLQQNSLPLRLRLEEWNCVFLRPNAAPAAVPLCEAAGREVTHAEVAEALRRGFGECFSADLGTGVPSQRESARAAKLAAPPL